MRGHQLRAGRRAAQGVTITTIVGIAENLHDSCLTVISDGQVELHLELERLTRRKRATFSSADQVVSLVAWALGRAGVCDPDGIGVARHAVEPHSPAIIEGLRSRYRHASIESFDHLECHSAYRQVSPFAAGAALALDGGGDRRIAWGEPNATLSFFSECGDSAETLLGAYELPVDGRAWAIASYALFGDVHVAGKTMGLAAYGEADQDCDDAISSLLAASLEWRYDRSSLETLAGPLRSDCFARRANLAYSLQRQFTDAVEMLVSTRVPPRCPLVLVGGCALNVTANTRLALTPEPRPVWVPPCPGDEGLSLGAALACNARLGASPVRADFPFLGLGPAGQPPAAAYRQAAECLAGGGVVAAAAGRGEVGPRALGNRSLLALPTRANRVRISEEMKHREPFRPVAPAFREADITTWLSEPLPSPFMSFAGEATSALIDAAPGTVHVDGSARHQTTSWATHPCLAALLDQLADMSIPPVVINTSLNMAGRPICLDESDALSVAIDVGAEGFLSSNGFTRLR